MLSVMSLSALVSLQFMTSRAVVYTGDYFTVDGNSGYQYGMSFRDPDGTGNVDYGEATFNELFQQSANKILLVQIFENSNPVKEFVYYKRYTCLDEINVYYLAENWMTRDCPAQDSTCGCTNYMGTDFDLYETLEDALADTNSWSYCNYDDVGVGMFRDCGPSSWTGNWNMAGREGLPDDGRSGGPRPAKFFIYAPEQEEECAAWGLSLGQPHSCACLDSCNDNVYCNTDDFVADRLETEAPSGLCSSETQTCCCSCPNCAEPTSPF